MWQSKWWVAVAVFALAAFTLPAQAQDQPSPSPAVAPTGQQAGMMVQSDKVIDLKVVNPKNEDLGRITDIVLTPDGHRVSYAVLSYGGLLSRKHFAVPWSAFQFQERQGKLDKATLDVPKATLDKASGFDNNKWPEQPQTDLFKAAMPEGQAMPAAEPSGQGTLNFEHRKLSKLHGMDVRNDREKLGDLDALMIGHRGMVLFGLVSAGTDKVSPVPWSAIQIRPDQKNLYLNVDKKRLGSITYKKEDLSKLNNHEEMTRIYQAYNIKPMQEAAMGGEGRFRQIAAGLFTAWAPDSTYNKLYKSDKVMTLKGTIEKVTTFVPEEGAAPGLRLQVKTEKNETFLVDAGPRAYFRIQNVQFKEGDRVEVTGSQAEFQGKSVLLASQIKHNEQTLRLRDQDGNPQWNIEQLQKGHEERE